MVHLVKAALGLVPGHQVSQASLLGNVVNVNIPFTPNPIGFFLTHMSMSTVLTNYSSATDEEKTAALLKAGKEDGPNVHVLTQAFAEYHKYETKLATHTLRCVRPVLAPNSSRYTKYPDG